jgi:hypothetical protein
MMMPIAEMREFAGFAPAEQRYIKRSLDIGLARTDAFRRWGRGEASEGTPFEVERFLGKLVRLAAFDLEQERLASFSAFRFLYERLLGARARPYLPAAFCAASALPAIRPERRKLLLQSLSEAAATASGWSEREPVFLPEYVDDFEAA